MEFLLLEINDDDLLDLLSDGEDSGVVKSTRTSDRTIPPVQVVGLRDNANLIPVSQHSPNSDEDPVESNQEDTTAPYEPSVPVTIPAVSKGTGVRPILKTPTRVGTGQVERKKSSVHFVKKQPESAQVEEDDGKLNSRKKSIDFSDGKPTESNVSLVTPSSISSTPVSSNNTAVGLIPHISLSRVDSVISSAPAITTATSAIKNPILNPISNTPSSDSLTAVSQANSLLSNNIDISNSDTSVRNEDPLQFGSYTPSSTPGRISSSRRSQSLPNTESLFKRPSRIDSLLAVSPNPVSKAGSFDQLATTITSTPTTQVYPSTPPVLVIPSTYEGHDPPQLSLSFTASPVQASPIAAKFVSSTPLASVPVTAIQQHHTTPMMSDVAFNTRNSVSSKSWIYMYHFRYLFFIIVCSQFGEED